MCIIVWSLCPTEFVHAVKEAEKPFVLLYTVDVCYWYTFLWNISLFCLECFWMRRPFMWILVLKFCVHHDFMRPVRWQNKLRGPMRSRLTQSINLDVRSTDFYYFRQSFFFFLSFVALYDRERPALAGSDTDKFNFPIMVSYKCPSLLGNLSPVVRQADKQCRVCWSSDFGSVRGERQLQPFGP